MIRLREIKESFLHVLFPHLCSGCGNDIIERHSQLCMRCLDNLPETRYEFYPHNPVEKIFWGRLAIAAASAQFYFTKESLIQELMHQFKYRQNKELGLQFGRMIGQQLIRSERFFIDALVPLPLFPSREKRRGYNQATVLCEGISEIMRIPVLNNVIIRSQHTDTQTRKGRIERWQNIEGKFILKDPDAVRNKHILLVDDVITTGATLESCGQVLIEGGHCSLSIATLCVASR